LPDSGWRWDGSSRISGSAEGSSDEARRTTEAPDDLHIHTTRILSLSDDLPVAIIIVDTDDRIRAFLPVLDELITEGLVILDDVEVVKYVGRDQRD
jgi:hypothetical protein